MAQCSRQPRPEVALNLVRQKDTAKAQPTHAPRKEWHEIWYRYKGSYPEYFTLILDCRGQNDAHRNAAFPSRMTASVNGVMGDKQAIHLILHGRLADLGDPCMTSDW